MSFGYIPYISYILQFMYFRINNFDIRPCIFQCSLPNMIIRANIQKIQYIILILHKKTNIYNETSKLPGFTETKEPRFRSQENSFCTELLNNNYILKKNDLVSDPVNGTLNGTINDTLNGTLKLREFDRSIIHILIEDPIITREELAEKMNVSIRTIQRELDNLKNRKIIMRVGSRKTGKWMVDQNEEKV